MGMWGSPDPSSRWMIEGAAIYNDGWCGEYSIDEIAAEFLSQNKLPPLETLFTDYRELGQNIQQLEKSWKSYLLNKVGADVDVDLETINDKGCG